MINEEILENVRRMTQSRIKDMIKQPDRYTLEEVQAARIVAQERNLDLKPKSRSKPSTPKQYKQTRPIDLSQWEEKTEPRSNTRNQKPLLPKSKYNPIPSRPEITNSDELPRLGDEHSDAKKGKSGYSIWWIIFLIYLFIKYFLN